MVQLQWKTIYQFLKKLNIGLPYNPEIPLVGIHPKELKRATNDICMAVLIGALFIITKRWEKFKWPSADEWINKM